MIALAAGVLSAGTAAAGDPWLEQAKLIAADGAQNDRLGTSVALDGDTVVVGARSASVDGMSQRGAVYVFVQSGEDWTEHAKLTALDGLPGDQFGISVALSGDTVLIGASGASNEFASGAAYVFERVGEEWVQLARLSASDGAAGDRFGVSVALFGDTALVGAERAEIDGFDDNGAAYVFTRGAGGTWTEQAKLIPDEAAAGAIFGHSVAVGADIALVGARSETVDGVNQAGAAYMFVREGEDWTQQARLTRSAVASNEWFGEAVALRGDTALVGAPQVAVGGNPSQGTSHVFTRNGETWIEQQELTAPDSVGDERFGISVALLDDIALVGADQAEVDGIDQGAAYVFTRTAGGAWGEPQKLTALDGAGGDRFGTSVALSGDTALVGANEARVDGNSRQGAAYVFAAEPSADPDLAFEPDSLDFGEVEVGETSDPQSATLSNNGGADATGLSFNTPANGFDADTGDCGDILPVGGSCEVSVTFTPTGGGPANATLEADNNEGVTAGLTLTGSGSTGEPGILAVEPAVLDFGEVPVGTTAADTIAVSNAAEPGAGTLTLSALDIAGDAEFEITGGTCNVGTTLKPGDTCTVQVTFGPNAEDTFSAVVGVATDDGHNATVDVLGSGAAPPALAFEPTDLDFGEVGVGETGGPQTATLHNTGDEELTGLVFSAPDGDFDADTSACGDSLGMGESCPVSITFTPSEPGPASAAVLVESNQDASTSLALSGMGGDGNGEPNEIFRDRFELE